MLSMLPFCTSGLWVISRRVSCATWWKLHSTIRMSSEMLKKVPDVEIEENGTFKYILIKVYAKGESEDTEPSKLIVRGGSRYGPYHADIYDSTLADVHSLGLDSECLGGGRISHEPENKKLNVYGYSQGFGKADHEITVSLLKKKYSDYNISWSNEGY